MDEDARIPNHLLLPLIVKLAGLTDYPIGAHHGDGVYTLTGGKLKQALEALDITTVVVPVRMLRELGRQGLIELREDAEHDYHIDVSQAVVSRVEAGMTDPEELRRAMVPAASGQSVTFAGPVGAVHTGAGHQFNQFNGQVNPGDGESLIAALMSLGLTRPVAADIREAIDADFHETGEREIGEKGRMSVRAAIESVAKTSGTTLATIATSKLFEQIIALCGSYLPNGG